MFRIAAIAALLCSTSALVLEEEVVPLRDVSPEEFHSLNLKQEVEELPGHQQAAVDLINKKAHEKVEGAKGKKKEEHKKTQAERMVEKKEQELKEHREQKRMKEREEEMKVFAEQQDKQMAEEDEIKKAINAKKVEAKNLQAKAKEEAKSFHFPWEHKTIVPKAAEAPTYSLIKEGKSLACTDGNKEVLAFYVSSMGGGVSTRTILNREKCMREQLNQHCMPYESFPATLIEPCDAGDWTCANKRVLNDHANCLTKSVDWEAVQTYAKESGKTMWDVLGSWCSKVKLLREVTNRMKLDEKFADDYPALLLLEDHVVLDKEWTEEVVKDWVANYDGQWDIVTLDNYNGAGLKRDKVRDFRGKPVYKPSWKGRYEGFQAVLLNTKSVPTLLERIQSLNVVPVEMLAKSLNSSPIGLEVLTWESGISSVTWEASRTQKEKWMPAVSQCTIARQKKFGY